jgi:arsenate reductase
MTQDLLFFHNPRCSKSREAMAALEARQAPVMVIEYLKEHLTREIAERIYDGLSDEERGLLVRTKEDEYVLSGLHKASSREEIITALIVYPKLLERPILVRGMKAAIGRPLEKILALLAE